MKLDLDAIDRWGYTPPAVSPSDLPGAVPVLEGAPVIPTNEEAEEIRFVQDKAPCGCDLLYRGAYLRPFVCRNGHPLPRAT